MFNLPYIYRHSKQGSGTGPGSALPGELPAKICGVDQAIWMTSRRDTLSGTTSDAIAPCYSCVAQWSDQSANNNTATLLNSTISSGDTGYWPDYWTGDTTNNFQPFISFDSQSDAPNSPNSLNIPYDTSFSKLTELTFSAIFRTRQIEPNSAADATAGWVLVQNGNSTTGSRTDGWGVDVSEGFGIRELRVWYYNNNIPGSFNEAIIEVDDWTDWMRLTVRISGDTIEVNLFNETEFIGNSGFTWTNGDENGSGDGISYAAGEPNWFIASQKGPGFPDGIGDHTILNGAWDIAEYVLYDEWLADSCVNTIWNYYEFRYDISNIQL